ncbi:proliferating cell nuclear antigen [Trichomonascus vanleenenianus]|uniref:proliferating cell nuclear antigen n=1 Tax=Trichomonascus vanleenenianus TaxID=2268995 RepID=UPI003ECAD458
MLEAKLDQASILKRVIEAIMVMVSECNFDCSEAGISVQAIDNSHISLVSLQLGSDGFSTFRNDRNMTLGVNINSLNKLLRCGGNDDMLTLQAEDTSKLTIIFEDAKQDKISEFNLKLLDIDQQHLAIPDTEYDVTITMASAQFQKIVRDLVAIEESIKIEANKEGVRFSCEGDFGDGSINLKPFTDADSEVNSTTIQVSEPVTNTLNGKYLIDICKAGSLSTQVTLRMVPDKPVEIEYKLPNGYLRYYLAPKIEDE